MPDTQFTFDIEALTLDTPEEQREPCKGLFFRCSVSSYLSSHKSIEVRKSLRFLKRRSCTGCPDCDGIWEYLQEDLANVGSDDYIGNLETCGVYEVNLNGGYDSYSDEGWCELEFREVK